MSDQIPYLWNCKFSVTLRENRWKNANRYEKKINFIPYTEIIKTDYFSNQMKNYTIKKGKHMCI